MYGLYFNKQTICKKFLKIYVIMYKIGLSDCIKRLWEGRASSVGRKHSVERVGQNGAKGSGSTGCTIIV